MRCCAAETCSESLSLSEHDFRDIGAWTPGGAPDPIFQFTGMHQSVAKGCAIMSRPAQLRHICTVKRARTKLRSLRRTWGSQMKEGGVELPAMSQACSSATSAERPARSLAYE